MATKVNINGVNEIDLTLPGTTTATIAAGVVTIINAGFNGVRKVTSSPDTILTSDNQKLVDYNSGSAVAVTLPQAGSAGFDNHFVFWVSNLGAGSVTITPTTSTIDGNATLVLDQGSGATIFNDGTNYFTVAGGGAATALTISIHQVGHGFSTGDAIYFTGSAWAKAKADVSSTLGIGLAIVVGADDFKVTIAGFIKNLSGFTAGQYYFVSDATPGALTSTEPTTALHYSNPLFFALSTTTGFVLPFRPSKIEQSENIVNVNTTYSAIIKDDIMADTSGGGFTITLPTVVGNATKRINIKKISSDVNSLTIAAAGGESIDGDSTKIIITPNVNMEIIADGTLTWRIQ